MITICNSHEINFCRCHIFVFTQKKVDDITVIVAWMKPFPKYVEDDASSDDSEDGMIPMDEMEKAK